MPSSYWDVYNSLSDIYDPQNSLVQQQIAALPGQFAPQYSALDQAKVNAFKDIDNSANAKGMLFSGFSPDQQAQYVGTKYLPARAALASQQQQQQFSLQDQLNKIMAARATQTQGIIADQTKAEIEQQKADQDAAYKQAQLNLGYARLSASGGGGRAPTAAQIKSDVANHIVTQFNAYRGRDGKVSNETWANGLNDWTAAGGKVSDFWKAYGSQYVNTKYKRDYAGYNQ